MKYRLEIDAKKIALIAMFLALSYIGAHIKIFGTVAFDSLPGFLSALLLGPLYGGIIGFLGHLLTALTSGFPLTIPLHLVIALCMALTMFVFGLVYKALKNRVSETVNLAVTGIVGVMLNGPVSFACSMGVLAIMSGKEAASSLLPLLPALILASIANVLLSIGLFKILKASWKKIR